MVLINLFLLHGFVLDFILVCTSLLLVKDKFKDITNSDSYRVIDSCCLLIKLLDILILLLEGDKFFFSELHFANQANVSMKACSCAVVIIVDNLNTRGTDVSCAAIDMSRSI